MNHAGGQLRHRGTVDDRLAVKGDFRLDHLLDRVAILQHELGFDIGLVQGCPHRLDCRVRPRGTEHQQPRTVPMHAA